MGSSDDVERLRSVLALCNERATPPRRVRVGDIEVEFGPVPPPAGEAHSSPTETDKERLEREQREFEAIMYAASEGADYS